MIALEELARAVASERGLRLGPPFALSHHSYVAPADEATVLKITPPEDDESDQEADALELWGGEGAVRLFGRDRARRALLIERAMPGTDLTGLPEEESTSIAVEVATRLWRPAGEPFRWIGDHVPRWLELAKPEGAGADELLACARQLYRGLSVSASTLVHGDFHHHNILRAGSRFLAIDPKPMLGEPEFNIPPFLWNPPDSEMTVARTEQRLAAFAGAGLEQARMRSWAVIRGAYLGASEQDAQVLLGLL